MTTVSNINPKISAKFPVLTNNTEDEAVQDLANWINDSCRKWVKASELRRGIDYEIVRETFTPREAIDTADKCPSLYAKLNERDVFTWKELVKEYSVSYPDEKNCYVSKKTFHPDPESKSLRYKKLSDGRILCMWIHVPYTYSLRHEHDGYIMVLVMES